MELETLLAPLREINACNSARECVERRKLPLHISGCTDSQKAHMIYGLSQEVPWKVIVVQNEIRAREVMEDYRIFDRKVMYFPAKDVIFYSADIHGNALTAERLKVVEALLRKDAGTVVTTMDAGMERLPELSVYGRSVVRVAEGDVVDLDELNRRLTDMGYRRQSQVEAPGEYSVRGGILDVFPMAEECPSRIELWGDEVDTIRSFDVESQRSIERVEALEIFPASEFVVTEEEIRQAFPRMEKEKEKLLGQLRREKKHAAANRLVEAFQSMREGFEDCGDRMGLEGFLPYFSVQTSSLFDFFPPEETVYFVDEPLRCREKMEAVEAEFRESMAGRLEKGYILPGQMELLYPGEEIAALLQRKPTVYLTMLDSLPAGLSVKESCHVQVQPVGSYNRHFELLVGDVERWRKNKYAIVFLAASRTRAERMSRDLNEYDIPAFYRSDPDVALEPGQVLVSYGFLKKGFCYRDARFVVITEGDVFGARARGRRRKQKRYSGKSIQSFHELSAGDYVVHENHGLGIYRGIEKIQVDGATKDYINIEYGDGGNLYVPVSGLDVLQKYAGRDAGKPRLNKLDSGDWKKTRSRVRGAVQEIARELVTLYARRQQMQGYAFGKDTVWQREFEELFPFEETQDQLRAIEETKRDMESTKIMDRLICGDVGYGKTEIAIRAAFKAVNDGKQVAFLVPTTILAQQHYNTIRERLGDFPVSVEMLSRFRTPAQQKKTIEQMRKGQVDIVVGTHRMLSKDVAFKDLGLLVVDEEQRFGVSHKEKIKQMKGNVDVLTLSATPIPRTLHMSLAGIRDMSVLEEPPVDRMPVQTFVMEHNPEIIREAVNRELARGGQIYYVYNRVQHIDEVAAQLGELVPDASVAYAHGQMRERKLENIMLSFINGEIDVLVSTTIIETGLDISNVNTIIIDNADQMGLSQLYQLRGRVGRSNRTAYAFLMYKRDKMLKEVAEKRLAAIREYAELGSGIKVAMRDLEIRGAGNLLGAAQSGHMEAVGYDLYCKMLNEAVSQLRDGEEREDFETSIDVQVDAFIPAAYIASEFQKLDMYKRIAGIEDQEECRDMQDELLDRFGEIPAPVENLLKIALIKADAHRKGVSRIEQNSGGVKFYLHDPAKVVPQRVTEMIGEYQGKMRYIPDQEPYFFYRLEKREGRQPAGGVSYSARAAARKKPSQIKVVEKEMLFEVLEDVLEKIGGLYEEK